jgi:hypothetical protein
LQADEEVVKAQIFNVVFKNFRVAELALHVQKALKEKGISVEIHTDYSYKGVRNYRISGKKIQRILNITPTISVEESVKNIVDNIQQCKYTDFDNPRYYNIKWLQTLEEADKIIKITGSVFGIQKNPFIEEVVSKINKEQ